MTNNHTTASSVVSETITYPSLVYNRHNSHNHHIAEDDNNYITPLTLSGKALRTYLTKRLKEQERQLPIRVQILLDDILLHIRKDKQVDVFDLLVELIQLADHEPAQCLSALLAALDDHALIELEPRTIKRTGEFLSDVLKRDRLGRLLERYHKGQKERRKQSKQD